MLNCLDLILYNALVCLMLESSRKDNQLSNIWCKYYGWGKQDNERN